MNVRFPLHVSGPFQCERRRFSDDDMHWSLFDDKCGTVAHVFDEAWAQKMAEALNCHDELVEACQAALDRLVDPYLGEDDGQRQQPEIEQLQAVLAKAKPGA